MSSTHTPADHRDLLAKALIEIKSLRADLARAQTGDHEPIAVIGMGCRFPGAVDSPEAFWQLLISGVDGVTDVPPSRWPIHRFFDPEAGKSGKMYTGRGGFLQDIDRFDAHFFGISGREAEQMDPQQRLLLEVAWETLERAGYAPDRTQPTDTGVFVGITNNDYVRLLDAVPDFGGVDTHYGTGNLACATAGRLAYTFGFRGPAMAIDTACSSSLVAVHQACASLRQRECAVALAGGVNAILAPTATIADCRGRMLSTDGQCKTFDATANGFVRSEGCGVVVLKRLVDAQRDGDAILTVIRGSAINQDGASSGFTAPNSAAQRDLIRRAMDCAGIEPDQVSFVETHGTGTVLGDPIEANALAALYGRDRSRERPLYIGSVKSNIGHAESAAGIASLIKVVLALGHETIPPNLHFKEPNPHIDWANHAIAVPTVPLPWSAEVAPRIAAVSSFGMTGTNVHAIVAQAPAAKTGDAETSRNGYILVLSARDDNALRELAARYAEFLEQHPQASLSDVCYTAAVGRVHFPRRLAVVGADRVDIIARLRGFVRNVGGGSIPRPELRIGESPPGGASHTVITADAADPDRRTGVRLPHFELQPIADRYLRGETIDWTTVWSGKRYRRIPLPTYPFQRQRYWLRDELLPAGDNLQRRPVVDNPFIGQWLNLPFSGEHRFEFRVNGRAYPWLLDHVLFDQIVVPGVAHLLFVVAAYAEIYHGAPCKLVGTRFDLALTLPLDGERVAQLIFTEGADGSGKFRVVSAAPDKAGGRLGPWSEHVSGEYRRLETGVTPTLWTDSVHSVGVTPTAGADFYREFTAAGYTLGRSFQWIETVRKHGADLLASLSEPNDIHACSGSPMHPGLLDSCCQPLLIPVLPQLAGGALFVPAAIETFQFHGVADGQRSFQSLVRVEPRRDGSDNYVRGDVRVSTPDGRPIVLARGIEARRMDHAALVRLTTAAASRDVSSTPLGDSAGEPLETRLRRMVAQVLGENATALTAERKFTDMGMDSIMIVDLRDRIQRELDVAVPVSLFAADGTLTAILGYVSARRAKKIGTTEAAPVASSNDPVEYMRDGLAARALVPLRSQGDRPPFFCVTAGYGELLALSALASHFDAERPFYALQPPLDVAIEAGGIGALAGHYLNEIRRAQPNGPYYLGGYCSGGMVAFELAQQIFAAGDTVAFLGLMDTPFNWTRRYQHWHHAVFSFLYRCVMGTGGPRTRLGRIVYNVQNDHGLHAHMEAVTDYVPKPYPGTITLISPRWSHFRWFTKPWDEMAKGGVEKIVVPGDHDSFIRDRHAPAFAQRLGELLV